jgi:hypothetical protein
MTTPMLKRIRKHLLFGNRAETDRQAVPPVDGNNGQCQVDQFFVGKMLEHFCIRLVRHVINRNQGHRLRPCQSCPLTSRVERGLAPGNKLVNALFCFAARPRSFGMQIDSISTPVDLRRANFDEFNEQRLLTG